MTLSELTQLAEGRGWYEEVAGQLWLERARILGIVNRRPPQCRISELDHQLQLLRARVDREHRIPDRVKLVEDMNAVDPARIVERW